MPRLLSALIPVIVAIALTVLPLGAAHAGEAKEFKAEGVDWTLPDGWSFGPVSSAEKSAGFFAKVDCSSASVQIWAYAKATEGLSLDERVRELTQAGGEGMGSVQATAVKNTTVSGVKGKVVVQRIKADGGAKGHFRKYVIVANGKFYQLLMRCWHEAHVSVTDEINAVRAGFRLKKGAGDKDVAEAMDEVEGSDGADGADGADGDSGGAGGDWPEKGPKREGRSIFLDNHNLHWTLPKDSPFQWTDGTDDASKQFGLFLTAAARVERKKKEFEKNTPDHNLCRLDLILLNTRPGFKAVNWIKGGGSQDFVTGQKFLDSIQAAKTRTKDEVKFGNIKAAYVKYEGKRGETQMVVMMFCTVLRGKAYLVIARSWGYSDAYRQMAPHVGKVLRGLKFLNTEEPVRGPLLGMVPDYAAERGKDTDKEKKYVGPGYVFEKPVGFSRIEVRDSMNRDLKFVGEGRSKDGKAYIYFEIRVISLRVASGQPMPDEEKFIEKRAQDWEAGAGPEADIGRGKKLKFKKGSFARERGLEYEFQGHLDEEPVIEQGYIVKHKQNLYWFKVQFIGKDAESKLKKLAKSIEKGVKFSR